MHQTIERRISLLRAIVLTMTFLVAAVPSLLASHNLAGQITYRIIPTAPNTAEITVTTYTDPSAALVDRCTIDMEIWSGNGQTKIADLLEVKRQNGPFRSESRFPLTCPNEHMGEYLLGNVKMNIYVDTFQFAGPGTYLIRFRDLARLDNIINMDLSGQQAFFVESTLTINPFLGEQNSPQFLNHPLDQACTGKLFTHNPGGYDPDGDSLVYRLVDCRQYDPPSIPNPITCTNFQDPDQVGNNGPFTMDPSTGLITWNNPEVQGIYNIAYVIEEYRRGIMIGYTYRDMAIFVSPCQNDPPVIESINDTCVKAGDTLRFDFIAYDPNFFTSLNPPGDSLYFYLNNNGQGTNNGPFAVANSPATIEFDPPGTPRIETDDTIRGTITWATNCTHIRNQFYQVDFYAHDNLSYFRSGRMLSANKIVKIRVVAPPVENLTATPGSRQVTLNWDAFFCQDVQSYEIYRRVGGSTWMPDTVCCEEPPTAAGFELVGTTNHRDSTTFIDDNNGQGFDYGVDICYVVIATLTSGGRSCPSNIACVQVNKDFPVLTQDSIHTTGVVGAIHVSWSQPTDIDTLFFPRPYTYELERADDINGPVVWTSIANGLGFNDTTFLDIGMNTEVRGYRYRVNVYDGTGQLISEGNTGSSIFLTTSAGDQLIDLSWSEYTPWANEIYYIFRSDSINGIYSLIDSVQGTGANTHTYRDAGLDNFEDYCYYVLSRGQYQAGDIRDSLLNASQKVCDIPQDLTPPCFDGSIIDTSKNCISFTVSFDWQDLDSACAGDLDYYNIFVADKPGEPYEFLVRLDSGTTSFTRSGLPSIADCYAISAVDTNGNESALVEYCFDNCPELIISNVFTPNGDDQNDFFDPFRERSVTVRMVQIFDRWGAEIYSTNSVPNINQLWDGRNNNGKEVPEGVYYYVIRYDEDRIIGDFPRPPLVGHVTLLR